MNLKPKPFIGKRDLHRFSQEQNKKSCSNINKTIWRAKLSCDESGASAIGLVIVTFFVFLLILLPMNLLIQELNLYRLINHKVQMATEMACFDAMLRLDANAMSEEKLSVDAQLTEWFEANMIERLNANNGSDLAIGNLSAVLLTDRLPNNLYVKFEYLYETQLVLKDHLSKRVDVELYYELPLNN